LFSVGKNSTTVKLAEPVPIEAVTNFNATGYGFGFFLLVASDRDGLQ